MSGRRPTIAERITANTADRANIAALATVEDQIEAVKQIAVEHGIDREDLDRIDREASEHHP